MNNRYRRHSTQSQGGSLVWKIALGIVLGTMMLWGICVAMGIGTLSLFTKAFEQAVNPSNLTKFTSSPKVSQLNITQPNQANTQFIDPLNPQTAIKGMEQKTNEQYKKAVKAIRRV